MRVSYSILIINTHVKTLNVLSFYSSVAFIIKAMEKVSRGLLFYALFYLFLVIMYALSYNALDLIWIIPSESKEGDAEGMGGMPFAMFSYSFRISLGDWKLNTFTLLEYGMSRCTWFLWLS